MSARDAGRALRPWTRPLSGASDDFDTLLDLVGDARFVLIGEATHGTHEFYRERAWITRRLIEEKGFTAVAVEGDWPDAHRVDRFVRGVDPVGEAVDALAGFKRFPAWMWRNADVLEFVGWLREHNDALTPGSPKAGFYGLDLYSLRASMEAVVAYLDRIDPGEAAKARRRYACFDQFGEDVTRYGYAASTDRSISCEDEIVQQLVEIQQRSFDYLSRNGRVAEDAFFYAEQNAHVARNAERYYRAMYRGRESSWNMRDRHMAETLDRLAEHLRRFELESKVVVWAHNSHVGDAGATDMGRAGEITLGQLVRMRHPGRAVLIGQTTFEGTVSAASDWHQPVERKRVRQALPGSYEALFHQVGLPRFLLDVRGAERSLPGFETPRLERAIGVVYRPQTERSSHYFRARLEEQFDVVLHVDRTRAVEPLETTELWTHGEEAPETYPTGV
ncbi:MAG TPA: erythromycin esterase family protein [Candidatus Dormibacteraeota bacterium]|nr:erythromycin esterase family protein [Candidatus Dormibacteraeota bacterium]